MDRQKYYTVGFGGQSIIVTYNGSEAKSLIEFLCLDLMTCNSSSPHLTYNVIISSQKPTKQIWKNQELLYDGNCNYNLAYILINEILFQSIVNNHSGYAIHAAAIKYGEGALLLPGKSGSGKSTLVTWLISSGATYLTDELVVISANNHCIHPFTRPINIKNGSSAVVSSFLKIKKRKLITGKSGFMLPHRLVNDNFSKKCPPLSHILFAEYKTEAHAKISRLSQAAACLQLMKCFVNARNIKNHGVDKIAALVRNIPVYLLTYSNLNDLKKMLPAHFPDIF